MLKNQPAISSIPLLRELHFAKFKSDIIEALETYIQTANKEEKEGWQQNASIFKQKLLQLLSSSSLLDLKNDLLLFCEDLRSPFNQILSTVVGPHWTKKIGNVFYAPGSTLQESLLDIAVQMNPFAAIYILNEIAMVKQKPIEITSSKGSQYFSFNIPLNDHEYLSLEGKRVLGIIVQNKDLRAAFLLEATGYGEEREARTLLDEFNATRNRAKPY
jgi:hypothetical protein